jgi:hypothetical protein
MRPWVHGAAALLAACSFVRTATAQERVDRGASTEERLDELQKQLDEQQKRLDQQAKEIDRLKSAPPPGGAKLADGSKPTDALGLYYDEGLEVRGVFKGQKYVIRPRARLQLDYRCFVQSDRNAPTDQFSIARGRVGFSGRFACFSFNLQVDPVASPNLPLGDFWFQWDSFDELMVRVGRFGSPFSLGDGMTDNIYGDCIYGPMVIGGGAALCPDGRPGVMALGNFREGILKYWVAAQSQTDKNAQITSELCYSARVQSQFAGLIIGASGRWDRRTSAQASFVGATPGGFTFFSPVNVNGWTQAYAGDMTYQWGPAWASFEYGWGHQDRLRVLADGRDGTPLITQGGYLTLGYKFWGPKKGHEQLPAPFADWLLFSPDIEKKLFARNVGAELVVRLEWCDIDDAADGRKFVSGAPAVRSTAPNAAKVAGNDAKAVTVGLNLYPIENVRFSFNYVHVGFGHQDRSERIGAHHGNEFLFRAQLEF